MNEKERQIISHLRKDARTSFAVISNDTQMPVSTIYDKINRLHGEKIIKRYTTLVDFSKLGYNYHAKLAIRVPKEQNRELLSFLQKHPSVNSLHEINNGFDFFVETLHKDIKEYLAFMEDVQECFDILELHEYQVINEIETEKVL